METVRHRLNWFFDIFAGADKQRLDKMSDRYTDTADEAAHRIGRSKPSHSGK